MSDHTITGIGDTWVNNTPNRREENYGKTDDVRLQTGEKRGYLLPQLPPMTGRVVIDAVLVGRAAGDLAAQTITVAPPTSRWQPGRIIWEDQPTVNNAAAVTVAIPATPAGGTVTIPGLGLMVQAVADGTPWWGLRLTTNAATVQKFVATDSGDPAWELQVVLSDVTDAATGLRPDGGLAVPTAATVLSWDAVDQVARRVQVDTPAPGADPDWANPDFDTQLDTTTSLELDLAAEGHTPPGVGPHHWRVLRVAEGDDVAPEWSDPATYTVAALHGVSVDSPVGPFGDPTPTVRAHITGGVLSHWKALITGPDRADVRYATGLSTGPIAFTVPETSGGRRVLVDDEEGWLNLRVWDDKDRATTVANADYAEVWVPLAFDVDLGVQAPSHLTVEQLEPGHPCHTWRWRRTEAADAWKLTVDSLTIARLAAEDVTDLGGGFYEWTDHGEISPARTHTLGVAALDEGAASVPVVREQFHMVWGEWIVTDDHRTLMLDNTTDNTSSVNTSRRASYQVQSGPPVDIVYDHNPGRTAAIAGRIEITHDRPEAAIWAAETLIGDLRRTPYQLVRRISGSQTMRVRLIDPDMSPAGDFLLDNLAHNVIYDYVQVGA